VQRNIARGKVLEQEHEGAGAVTGVEGGDEGAGDLDRLAHVDRHQHLRGEQLYGFYII
jgi:hypothetical protein